MKTQSTTQTSSRLSIPSIFSFACLAIAAVLLLPLGWAVGWVVWLVGVVCLVGAPRQLAKEVVLVYGSLAILGVANVSTNIEPWPMATISLFLAAALSLPFVVLRFVYKQPEVIHFPFRRVAWSRNQVGYLILAAIASYFILPLWMQTTGAYMNWMVPGDAWGLGRLFAGTNGLGIWDELFFIVTVLAILQRHLPFHVANALQAVLFTSFLYELGFTGWAPLAVYPFALLQGLVFKKTDNLLYVIAIHLTIDFILYLALVNAHHPHLLPIFVISPS